ncbi:MAG: hypothetical protein MHM6MM_001871 [Cercozoa sp. M6MM]
MSYLSALDGATSEADLLRRLADLRAEDARLDVDGVSGALVAAGAFFGRRKRAHFVGICERTLQDHALVKIESARNSEQALVSLLEDIGDSVGSDARVAPHALRRFRHDDLLRRLLRRFPKTPIPASLCHVVCELEFAQFATQMLPLRLAALESSMALPIFRVLALLKSMRRFLFVLSHAYEPFGALLLLLFCVFFFFGTVAVTLFYGTFDDAVRRQLGYDAHFDSLGHSVLSLFQVFVGEAFHEIAYAAANATQQFAAIWFFLVFGSLN